MLSYISSSWVDLNFVLKYGLKDVESSLSLPHLAIASHVHTVCVYSTRPKVVTSKSAQPGQLWSAWSSGGLVVKKEGKTTCLRESLRLTTYFKINLCSKINKSGNSCCKPPTQLAFEITVSDFSGLLRRHWPLPWARERARPRPSSTDGPRPSRPGEIVDFTCTNHR